MKLFVALLVLTIVGCSSTTVYLNTRYLSDSESQNVIGKLEQSGFSVETNTFDFPQSVIQSSLIYSPMVKNREAIDRVIDVLTEINWNVPSVRPLVSNNHWFTKNSVGLYLVPEGVQTHGRRATQDLANIYKSRNCNANIEINFKSNGSYEIVFDADDKPHMASLKGSWAIRSYPYVELRPTPDSPWYYFEIENKVETDKVSDIEIVELKPAEDYEQLSNCTFVYGLRL
jgi:hypothetical protein